MLQPHILPEQQTRSWIIAKPFLNITLNAKDFDLKVKRHRMTRQKTKQPKTNSGC